MKVCSVYKWNKIDISHVEFDGLFLSNGPGDPQMCSITIKHIQTFLQGPKPRLPVFGICLGHQLLSLAAGTTSYKMKSVTRAC